MLMIPPSTFAARRKLLLQAEAGALTREQAFQQALELDPNDWVALGGLALVRREAGNIEEAERLAWRGLRANPCQVSFYVLLSDLVKRHKQSASLAEGLLELALSKTLQDDDELEDLLQKGTEFKSRADIEKALALLTAQRKSQPRRVEEVLRPFWLVHELQIVLPGRLDRELVDLVVKLGADCGPLLVGVLRAWFSDAFPEGEDFPAEASLALLGEIGDPAALHELLECCTLREELLSEAAHWAVARIAERRPAETLQSFQRIAADSDPFLLSAIAQHLALMPSLEGARELLLGMIGRLGSLRKSERDGLFLIVATALLRVESDRGPATVKAAFDRHSRELTQKGRARCYQMLKAWDPDSPPEIEPDPRTVYDFCCWGEREEEEEPMPEAPAPERAEVPSPGRKLDSVEVALREKLSAFPIEALRKRELESAAALFAGGSLGAPLDSTQTAGFLEWLIHDYVNPRLGRTLIEEFLSRNRSRLTMRERILLERWSASRQSLFEVQRVEPEKGIEIKDLFTGEVLFANDVSASRQAAQWDCVILRVEPAQSGMELVGVGLTVPRQHCEPLREWALEDRKASGLPWPEYLRANGHSLRRKALEIGEQARGSLKVVSAEGDPVVFSEAAYRVLDEAALLRALDASQVLDRENPQEGRFIWFEELPPGSETRRSLGSLRVENGRLVLQTNSKERLARGRALIEGLAGAALAHQGDKFTGLQTAMRRHKGSAPPPESKIPPEVQREIIGKYMAEHYRTWPDTPLPALDGQTPRQAAATPQGRSRVAELLKLFENGEDRKRRAGEPWFDVSVLKADLKIDL
jgi:tetratricopeptide (TPR) repeat protein